MKMFLTVVLAFAFCLVSNASSYSDQEFWYLSMEGKAKFDVPGFGKKKTYFENDWEVIFHSDGTFSIGWRENRIQGGVVENIKGNIFLVWSEEAKWEFFNERFQLENDEGVNLNKALKVIQKIKLNFAGVGSYFEKVKYRFHGKRILWKGKGQAIRFK